MVSLSLLETLKIDFFSQSFQFTFKGASSTKSTFGIIITYIFVIYSIVIVILLGQELIMRQNPNVIMTETQLSPNQDSRLNLLNEETPLLFGLFENNQMVSYDISFFKVQGYQRKTLRTDEKLGKYQYLIYEFDVVPCPLDRVPPEEQKDWNHSATNPVFLCMDNDLRLNSYSYENTTDPNFQKDLLYIEGIMGSKETTELFITFERCVNGTNVVCRPSEEIEQKLNNIFIGGTFKNRYLNLRDYRNPLERKLDWFYTNPSMKVKKEIRLFFQKHRLINDIGLINTREEYLDYFTFEKAEQNIEQLSLGNNNTVMTIALQVSSKQRIYNRRYRRIQEVLGEATGVLKLSLFLFSLLVKPLTAAFFRDNFLRILFSRGVDNRKINKVSLLKHIVSVTQNYTESKDKFIKLTKFLSIENIFGYLLKLDTIKKLSMRKKENEVFDKVCENTKESFIMKNDQFSVLSEQFKKKYMESSEFIFLWDYLDWCKQKNRNKRLFNKNFMKHLNKNSVIDKTSSAKVCSLEMKETPHVDVNILKRELGLKNKFPQNCESIILKFDNN